MKRLVRAAYQLVKSDFAQNLARDLKSLRAGWTHVYLTIYAYIAVWSVHHFPEAVPTVVTVTGGVVSAIFAGYVLTKRASRSPSTSAQPQQQSSEDQDGD